MAIDTQEKRMSVVGVGRPWFRSKLPGAIDAAWRQASAHIYAGVVIAAPSLPKLFTLIAAQTLVDGVVKAQTLIDGAVEADTLVDGAVKGQTLPT